MNQRVVGNGGEEVGEGEEEEEGVIGLVEIK